MLDIYLAYFCRTPAVLDDIIRQFMRIKIEFIVWFHVNIKITNPYREQENRVARVQSDIAN